MEIKRAAEVAARCAEYGIRQGELASRVGVHPRKLNDMLHGRRPFRELIRIRVEQALNDLIDPSVPPPDTVPPRPNIRRL